MPGAEIGYVLTGSTPSQFDVVVKKDSYVEAEEFIIIKHPNSQKDTFVLGLVFSVKNVNLAYSENSPLIPFFQEGIQPMMSEQDYMVASIDALGYIETDSRGIESLIPLTAAPNPGQPVFRATNEDIQRYIMTIEAPALNIGILKNYEQIPVTLSIPKLFMHLAILGITGAGKSHLLKRIILSVKNQKEKQIPLLIIDPHGEFLDYADEIIDPSPYLGASIYEMNKYNFVNYIKTFLPKGKPMELIESAVNKYVREGPWPPNSIQPIIDLLDDEDVKGSSKGPTIETAKNLLSTQKIDMMFKTAPLNPKIFMQPQKIICVDMGQINLTQQQRLLARILRLLHENAKKLHINNSAFAGLIILDEVQRYAPEKGFETGEAYGDSKSEIFDIAAQGRKFGIGLILATQRPAYVSKSVLAQCNSQFIFRLVARNDVGVVRDILGNIGILERLPFQPTGDAILFGVASSMNFPVVTKIDAIPPLPATATRQFNVKFEERLKKFKDWFDQP